MAELNSKITAEAEIENTFALTGRGWVLVLKNGFSGTIPSSGMVESDQGITAYTGPEFVDSIAQRKAWLAVIVDENAKELFAKGQSVRFYKRVGTA